MEVIVHLHTDLDTPLLPRREIRLTQSSPSATIGRSSQSSQKDRVATLTNGYLGNPVISQKHAELKADFDRKIITLKDLGSTHGTFVNDIRLVRLMDHAIREGDRVQFGTEVIRGPQNIRATKANMTTEWQAVPPARTLSEAATNVFTVPDDTEDERESDNESVREVPAPIPVVVIDEAATADTQESTAGQLNPPAMGSGGIAPITEANLERHECKIRVTPLDPAGPGVGVVQSEATDSSPHSSCSSDGDIWGELDKLDHSFETAPLTETEIEIERQIMPPSDREIPPVISDVPLPPSYSSSRPLLSDSLELDLEDYDSEADSNYGPHSPSLSSDDVSDSEDHGEDGYADYPDSEYGEEELDDNSGEDFASDAQDVEFTVLSDDEVAKIRPDPQNEARTTRISIPTILNPAPTSGVSSPLAGKSITTSQIIIDAGKQEYFKAREANQARRAARVEDDSEDDHEILPGARPKVSSDERPMIPLGMSDSFFDGSEADKGSRDPEHNMTSAAQYNLSKKAASLAAQETATPTLARAQAEQPNPDASMGVRQSSPTGPRTSPAYSARATPPPQRLGKRKAEQISTAPAAVEDQPTTPRTPPTASRKPHLANNAGPRYGEVDEPVTPMVSSRDERFEPITPLSMADGDVPDTLPEAAGDDARQSKRICRRAAEIAGLVALGGAAVFAALVHTAPDFA